ncbi:hypothetical protein ACOME3_005875 [Neoechinorhynchus agilis]
MPSSIQLALKNRVYIEGLPRRTTERCLIELFKEFGDVDSVDLRPRTSDLKNAVITFVSEKSASKVLNSNPFMVGGVKVVVRNHPGRDEEDVSEYSDITVEEEDLVQWEMISKKNAEHDPSGRAMKFERLKLLNIECIDKYKKIDQSLLFCRLLGLGFLADLGRGTFTAVHRKKKGSVTIEQTNFEPKKRRFVQG